jgi:hypothetical protein
MALVLADRVQETSNTTSTGDLALNGALPTYQSFALGIGVGNTCYYAAYNTDQSVNEWEVGVGTLSGVSTLVRTTILSSSNAGSIVNFSAGSKLVYVTLPAERAVYENAAGDPPFATQDESVAITIALG